MAASLGAYIELMRPKNLILAGATVPLGAYFALMKESSGFPVLAVSLHVLAVVLFTGAGNAMNDIKDAAIDRTAHPMRPLPSGRLTTGQARAFTSLLWGGSVFAHVGGLLAATVYRHIQKAGPQARLCMPCVDENLEGSSSMRCLL